MSNIFGKLVIHELAAKLSIANGHANETLH